MKRNLVLTALSQFVFIGIILLLSLITNNECKSQLVRNCSFERHPANVYPYDLPPNTQYAKNIFMICLGYCRTGFSWPPFGQFNHCDYNTSNPPSYDGGWYWATNWASPDYYHIKGTGRANSPLVRAIWLTGADSATLEKRWPLGYHSEYDGRKRDSGFVGIRIIPSPPSTTDPYKKDFSTYKEYIQSKLTEPLVGPAAYEVSYFVSRSKWSKSIKKMCALFTAQPFVVPLQDITQYAWSTNLINPYLPPFAYIENPQVCSEESLTATADTNGNEGWQEVTGILVVPDGVTYNYITVGNFQSDYDLWNDIDPKPYVNPNLTVDDIYYFVDSVTVIPKEFAHCVCNKAFVEVKIVKQVPSSDSTKCCYNYEIYIPDFNHVPVPICPISKIKVSKNASNYLDTTSTNENFNGDTIRGSFCADKFNSSDNFFSVQFYEKVGSEYVLHPSCTRSIVLNCECDCSNLTGFPYPKNKAKFSLVKVDAEESGNCCWDVVLENPYSNDSSNCEYNLSNLYLIASAEHPQSYQFSSGAFQVYPKVTQFALENRWKAPDNFILKPGDKVTIGTICSYGIPDREPVNYNDVEFNFIMSSSNYANSGACDTVLSRKLSCDTTSLCCDSWELSNTIVKTPYWDPVANTIKTTCAAILGVYFNSNIQFCNYNDSLLITVTDSTDGFSFPPHLVVINDLYYPWLPLPWIYFENSKTICITVKNLVTNDSCKKCITLVCTPYVPSDPGKIETNVNNRFGIGFDESIRVYPNPFESYCIVEFNSGRDLKGVITIQDNLGKELVTQSVNTVEGVNTIKFDNLNLTTGLYFITVKLPDRYDAKQVIFIK